MNAKEGYKKRVDNLKTCAPEFDINNFVDPDELRRKENANKCICQCDPFHNELSKKEMTMELITQIEDDIMRLTGLTKDQLDTMDSGDIEQYLGIEVIDPSKRKSLYKIVSSEKIEWRKKVIDKLLNDMDT